MNYLPEKLLTLRKHYNYSQRFVANVLNIDVLEYMGFENGRSVLNFAQVKKLAKFYHISYCEMFSNQKEVTLYDVSKSHTDEINIEYFLPPKDNKAKVLEFIQKYKLILSSLVAVVLIALFILLLPKEDMTSLSLKMVDTDRLDASKTSVVYVDDTGIVRGNGDNTNGQLNLDFNDVIMAKEGYTFTVVLHEDGTLDSTGLMQKYAEEIKCWKNIVDVECGIGHIIALDHQGNVYCTGDNTFGQCKMNGQKGVKSIFATDRGSVVVKEDGSILSSGSLIGSSRLKGHSNIIDLASSDTLLVLLNKNGHVEYYSDGKSYDSVPLWEDIVQVACGNDFIAGLSKDGKVYIDIDNYLIAEEVEKWTDVIAIASGPDYLVSYDGKTVKGVGKNTYKQFETTATLKQQLPQVKNIQAFNDENYVTIQFDSVPNASGYLVEVNTGTGFSAIVNEPIAYLDVTRFVDGRTYQIDITALGHGDYTDSLVSSSDFTYRKKKVDNGTITPPPTNNVVEVPFALDQLIGKSKVNFEAYLKGLGVSVEKMHGSESSNICEGPEATIETVIGVDEYEMITKSDLAKREITYTYCKVGQ